MFRKSLLSAITIFLAGQFCLISESVTAGSFTDYIRNECPREYDLYKSAVTEFAIRMKPNVGQCGCDVVGLYYALSRNSMELVAQLEEDAELMQSAARVFGISEELTEALGNAPEAVSTLTILAEHDPRLFQKLSDALSLFSRSDRKKLSKNPNYILYYLLAAAMADAQGSGIASMVKRLKRRIAPGAMDVFSLLYTQTFSVYPHADTDYRFSAADATLGKLGMKNVRAVRPYKAHLALFLPPTEKEIPESQNLNKTEYEQLKEDHINLLVRVSQNISDKYGLPYGLKVVEHIAPHLMDALRFHNNKNQIGAYLDHESESRLFEEVLKNGVCQSGSGDGRLESFFSMYSPYSKKGEPLAGTKGNLGLIAKWFAEGNLQKYIAKADNLENYICSMAFLPRIFAESDPGQEKVFDDLLFSLSESPGLNGLFIAALYNKTNYFRWLRNSPNAFSAVVHNPDAAYGRTAPKYKYILTTSYPEDKSGAILHSFDGEHISASALNHLMYMDIDKLEEHNFTEKERDMALAGTVIDVADWTGGGHEKKLSEKERPGLII